MTVTNTNNTGQVILTGFVESSTALQIEAARIESAVELCKRHLQITIPDLIKTVGELKAVLVQAQAQNSDLNVTCRSEILALDEKKSQLIAAIEQEKKKIGDLQIKLGQLNQQLTQLNSPAGLVSAYQQEQARVAEMFRRMGW